jgi:hypothetical protein
MALREKDEPIGNEHQAFETDGGVQMTANEAGIMKW